MPVCCIGVHLSGLKGFIVLRCHIATESKEDRRLFKVHESRGSMKKEKNLFSVCHIVLHILPHWISLNRSMLII
jgi:hypothetical protein